MDNVEANEPFMTAVVINNYRCPECELWIGDDNLVNHSRCAERFQASIDALSCAVTDALIEEGLV